MTEETTLYSGELSLDDYNEVSEVVEDFATAWIHGYIDMILESNGEARLRVEGPEQRGLFSSWEATETYEIDSEAAEYLRRAFE